MLTPAAKRLRPAGAALRRQAQFPPVFVIERDDAVRLSLAWLLEGIGAEVQVFASTGEFLANFNGSRGCLLLDIGPHGIERLRRFGAELASRQVALPVVAISSDPFISAEEAQSAGAAAFLPKPFACEALIHCLRQVRSASNAFALVRN